MLILFRVRYSIWLFPFIEMKNIFLLIILLAIGCGKHRKDDVEVINLDLNFLPKIDLTDRIAHDTKLIPLESNEESLFGEISRIIIHDSLIYILDRSYTKKIYCFDLNGRFRFSFGQVGQASDEYISPTDFAIFEDKIIVIDKQGFAKLTYDLEGSFLEKINLDFYVWEIVPFNQSQILSYLPTDYVKYTDGTSYSTNTLQIHDASLSKELDGWLPYEEGTDDSSVRGLISKNKDHFSYIQPMKGEIYQISTAYEIHLAYKMNFGKYDWPKPWDEVKLDQSYAEETFFSGGVMTMCHNIQEDDNYIFLNAYTHNPEGNSYRMDLWSEKWQIFIDKNTNQALASKLCIAGPAGDRFTSPVGFYDGYFISPIFSEDDDEEISNPKLFLFKLNRAQ